MADSTPSKQAGSPVGSFQDPLLQVNFDDPEKKKDKEYGRTLLARIYKEQNNQSSSFYFGGRNIRWMENWQWAMGRQNMNEFTDYVSMEGNKAYAPVDMTQNRIGPQFLGVLVDSMSQNEEYPCVTAIDDGSLTEKEKQKLDALFRMHQIETIRDMQQQSGAQLEPSNAYTPDDELSAEIEFKLNQKLPKEIEFEEFSAKVMTNNQFSQKSRQTKRDLIVLNCGITKVERNDRGFISIRKVTPANSIYNFFTSDSGQMELSYIGEVYSLKVKDLRSKYGQSDSNKDGLTEKEIFEMARTANQFNNANRFVYYWNESYLYATDRPYDDYSVQVFDCEIQCFDADYYVSKKDTFGKESIKSKSGIPQPQSGKATVIKKDKLTVYRGIWAVKADKMIFWGLPDLVIKPFMNISQSLFSYSIQIPNNDGDYVPSLFERGLSPLRKWTLCDLKLKQLIANLRASGVTIDTEQVRDIDMGDGKTISALEVIRIYNQTGNVIWSSKGLNPNERQEVPIREMPNAGSVMQLQELVNVKNDSMQELRSVWGVPLYRDGSDLPPRMGQAVVENQNVNANNVTDFINFSDKCLWEETLYKVVLLHWDDVVLKNNRTELMDTEFEVSLELKPTTYEKQMLEDNIKIAMQSIDQSTGKPLLSFKDAFKIRNIKNYKLAEMYLANMIDKNERDARQKQLQDQQANIQSQQQSAILAAEQQAKQQEAKIDADKDMKLFETEQEMKLASVNGLWQAISKGIISPNAAAPILKELVPNITIPLTLENEQFKQGALTQMQQEVAAAQQQAQQPQGQPQGQPQPPQSSQQMPPDQTQIPQQ